MQIAALNQKKLMPAIFLFLVELPVTSANGFWSFGGHCYCLLILNKTNIFINNQYIGYYSVTDTFC